MTVDLDKSYLLHLAEEAALLAGHHLKHNRPDLKQVEKTGDHDIKILADRISEERQARHLRELQEVRESLARRRRRNDRNGLAHERVEAIEKLASELDRALQVRALVGVINNEEHAPPASRRLARWDTELAD